MNPISVQKKDIDHQKNKTQKKIENPKREIKKKPEPG